MIDVLLALLAVPAIAVPIVSVATSGPAKPIAHRRARERVRLARRRCSSRSARPRRRRARRRYGAWLALAGALLAWVGSWLSLRDESTPGAVAPDIPRRPAPA